MIFDLVIILIILLSMVIGYKVGFLVYILKVVSIFTGLLTALLFTSTLANYVIDTSLGDDLIVHFTENINEAILEEDIVIETDTDLADLLELAGIPGILTYFIEESFDELITADDIIYSVAYTIAKTVVIIGSFIFLWIGTTIIISILKLFAKGLRKIKVFKIFDSLLGVVLSVILSFILIQVAIAACHYSRKLETVENAVGSFVDEQYDSSFGIYYYLEDENFIINFIDFLF